MELTKEDIQALEAWIDPEGIYACLAYYYIPTKDCNYYIPSNIKDILSMCSTACVKIFPEVKDQMDCPCNIHSVSSVREKVRRILKENKKDN